MHRSLKKILFFLCSVLIIKGAFAGAPLWTFEPLTATTISVPANGTATIQYRVTNQTSKPRTLVMQPIQGISQITTGLNVCGSAFFLRSNESCILSLQVNGSALNTPIINGPVVCQQGSNNQCYRPGSANVLNINRQAQISITSPVQHSRVVTVSSLAPLSLEITNNADSGINADAITVISKLACPGLFVEDGGCASLAPGDTCRLELTSNVPYAPCNINISGSNTNNLQVLIAFSYLGGLVFEESGGSGKVVIDKAFEFNSPWMSPPANASAFNSNDGILNTGDIIGVPNCSNNPLTCAAQRCQNILPMSEWYLPAINELSAAHSSLCSNGSNPCNFGDFILGNYWSSTQLAPDRAFAFNFLLVTNTFGFMFVPLPVRCIRAF